jgi:hypothetical protein
MKVIPEGGCAICSSTWGNYWEEVEGQRMFFCCEICATQFKNMISEVKSRTGWREVEEVRIRGDYRGREVTAIGGGSSPASSSTYYKFLVRFNSRGDIQSFTQDLPGTDKESA